MQILFNSKGIVRPGEVLGLMGPSGSGKTSLISILGGRKPPGMTVTGDILFNGSPLSRSLKSNIGYVLQDDLLFDSLTVYETLLYAARLRLPKETPMYVRIHEALGCAFQI
jgi:ABC-type multidrug transport system ATPase subunit